jgi:acylphosphatase
METAVSVARTVRLRIEGRVQGVGYRVFVERNAIALGLDGWVRNRRDGGVEAVVSGTSDAVDELIARCRKGPPASRVDRVEVLAEDEAVAPGFTVRPTV